MQSPNVRNDALAPIARSATVRDEVYKKLRRAIIQGDLHDGFPLVSTELSERLAVSRTPVREAIVRLVQDGLAVETESGQVIVRPVSLAELESFFEIRAELERFAARAAVERGPEEWLTRLKKAGRRLEEAVDAGADPRRQVELNEEFHRLLYEGSGNVLVERTLHDLEAMTARRVIERLYEQADPQTTTREHRAILAAIEARDAGAAGREAAGHVERAGAYFLELLRREPDEGAEVGPAGRA